MKEEDPFERFMVEATKFLDIAKKNQSKPLNITPEIEAKLVFLEQFAEVFTKAHTDAIQQLGIDDQQLQKLIQQPENVSSQQARKLEKLQKLKEEVELAQRNFEQAYLKEQELKKNQGKPGKPSRATKGRKKKFRSLGSQNDWKPL